LVKGESKTPKDESPRVLIHKSTAELLLALSRKGRRAQQTGILVEVRGKRIGRTVLYGGQDQMGVVFGVGGGVVGWGGLERGVVGFVFVGLGGGGVATGRAPCSLGHTRGEKGNKKKIKAVKRFLSEICRSEQSTSTKNTNQRKLLAPSSGGWNYGGENIGKQLRRRLAVSVQKETCKKKRVGEGAGQWGQKIESHYSITTEDKKAKPRRIPDRHLRGQASKMTSSGKTPRPGLPGSETRKGVTSHELIEPLKKKKKRGRVEDKQTQMKRSRDYVPSYWDQAQIMCRERGAARAEGACREVKYVREGRVQGSSWGVTGKRSGGLGDRIRSLGMAFEGMWQWALGLRWELVIWDSQRKGGVRRIFSRGTSIHPTGKKGGEGGV